MYFKKSHTATENCITDNSVVTCISSSLDWMSGGKSPAPQLKGSKGSAPKRSLSGTREKWVTERKSMGYDNSSLKKSASISLKAEQ